MRVGPIAPLVVAALLPLACGSAQPTQSAKGQLEFGAEMAERGLWNEALFRFRQAERTGPDNPRVWNNLAVAYEATGNYDEALKSYRRALELDPGQLEIKRNYARFVEFYQSFKPKKGDEAKGSLTLTPPPAPPATRPAQPVPPPDADRPPDIPPPPAPPPPPGENLSSSRRPS